MARGDLKKAKKLAIQNELLKMFPQATDHYEEKKVGEEWYIKSYNGGTGRWQVSIYSEISYRRYKAFQKKRESNRVQSLSSSEIVTFQNSKNQTVGYLKNRVYRRRADSRIHKLRVMDAYGLDDKIFRELDKLGCKEIRILEVDTNRVLSVDFIEFKKLCIYREFDGKQVFLPVKYFTDVTKEKEEKGA